MARFSYLVPLIAIGCSVSRANPDAAMVRPTALVVTANAPESTRSASSPAVEEDTGGMWLPEQIPSQAVRLRRMGLAIDPVELSTPTSKLLGAILNLNGCSASFVSPDGLIATNHHCATSALQYNSTPGSNLLEDGFLARTPSEERSSGPTARALLTFAIRDVTDDVRAALTRARDDLGREQAYEAVQKQLVQHCERARSNLRCKVVSFYEGQRYALFERLELRDVRIVYAPPEGIGNFGGEVDNWRWPRHTGDVTLLRAYVGRNGLPAAYSSDNVPYRPAHWLKLADAPLREGDLVLVAGFPGRTSRLATVEEVEDAVQWLYPRRQRMFDEYLAVFDALASKDREASLMAVSWVRGFHNVRTKNRGELEGMQRADLLTKKRAETDRLRASIANDAIYAAQYGAVFEGIASAFAVYAKTREADTELESEISMPRLVSAANRIVRMAEERALPDAARDPNYQERNHTTLRDELAALDRLYHPTLDETVLMLALERTLKVPLDQRTPALEVIAGKQPTVDAIRRSVSAIYAKTKLADAKLRLGLFNKATMQQLRSHPDSMIRLAVALRPLLRDAETRRKILTGRLLALKPLYIEALLKLLGPNVPPDANGTLRVAFGAVRQEPKRMDCVPSRAFTTLTEMVNKHQGRPPFAVPERLLQVVRERRLGRYLDSQLGDVPVNFLSDVNITNGNSGSATLNARGELVGLAFDGTYESVASDWRALPETRAIHVDMRYVLWLLDHVEHADHLLRELGVATAAPTPASSTDDGQP